MEDTLYYHNELQTRVKQLADELPGVTFGYIGNLGVDRSGPFDDRSWFIFLPHPGRVGTYLDRVALGNTDTLHRAVERWSELEDFARRAYHKENRG